MKRNQKSDPKPDSLNFVAQAADASGQPATEAPGDQAANQAASGAANQAGDQVRCADVGKLGAEMEKVVWSMLVDGHSFEETAEYVNERHKPEKAGGPQGITVGAVRRFFRGSKTLQAHRVRHMQELTQEIKKTLVGKPDAAEADVIDAIIFTGLMGVERGSMPSGVSDAAKQYVACQALRMKQQMHNEKVRTERVQRRVMKKKLVELTRTLKRENGGRALGPETLERIREIYGLFARNAEKAESAPLLDEEGGRAGL